MTAYSQSSSDQTVVARLDDFDRSSGSVLERLIFNHRGWVLLLCTLITLALGWQVSKLDLNASFEKTIPTRHPYVVNYLSHKADLAGQGNVVRIAVESRKNGIYTADYAEALRKLNDELYLLPGVDRPYVRSLWSPSTRWVGVTEDGLEGGPVIPERFDGSAARLQELQVNVQRSGEVGKLVSYDAHSSIIELPLLSHYSNGRPLDYAKLSSQLEALRQKYESDRIAIHIVGFAKVSGDLIDGLKAVIGFFAIAVAIATAVLFWFTRCWRSTLLVASCSLIAVIWQLGTLPPLGYGLDPYSAMVPFLVFAIGMSHGAQKMNGIMQDIGRGTHRVVAARFTFRRLFLAGLTALICDAVGFAVLTLVDIQAIRDLALIASIGVAMLIFTNLILLPVLLSFAGVSPTAALRSLQGERMELAGTRKHVVWRTLDLFTQRRWATVALAGCAALALGGWQVAQHVKVGDLDPGAPELRPESRYNRDSAFINSAYGASSDVFTVMVKTPDGECSSYATLRKVDLLESTLRELPGVESTKSLASLVRQLMVGLNEGSAKWYEVPQSQPMLNTITAGAPRGLYNDACSLLTLNAYLQDHKADTLSRVAESVEHFASINDTAGVSFQLAAGSAGIEAATNSVVTRSNHQMLLWVYSAVIVLCLVTFRSWRAVVCAVVPLMLTSLLCEALMATLGIGIKVATLPVIALGVGIGVDYSLYILTVTLAGLRAGESLSEAYYRALLFTGKVVLLTGLTLSFGVATWLASPIKFQADMGLLLAFMFLLNMLGALVLVPALAHFLLKTVSRRSSLESKDQIGGVVAI